MLLFYQLIYLPSNKNCHSCMPFYSLSSHGCLVTVLKALLLSRHSLGKLLFFQLWQIYQYVPIFCLATYIFMPLLIVFLISPGCMVQLNFPPLFCRLAHFAVRENAFIWCRKNVALIQLSVLSLQLPVRYPGPRQLIKGYWQLSGLSRSVVKKTWSPLDNKFCISNFDPQEISI